MLTDAEFLIVVNNSFTLGCSPGRLVDLYNLYIVSCSAVNKLACMCFLIVSTYSFAAVSHT